jgi:hypothetical protein
LHNSWNIFQSGIPGFLCEDECPYLVFTFQLIQYVLQGIYGDTASAVRFIGVDLIIAGVVALKFSHWDT